jgi:hypothetical protein
MSGALGKFNVGGVLLNQPFKIRRLGHFEFNLSDVEAGIHFYVDLLGAPEDGAQIRKKPRKSSTTVSSYNPTRAAF